MFTLKIRTAHIMVEMKTTERKEKTMFTLKIRTAGSAFEDPFFDEINDVARQKEVARILRETAEKLELYAEIGKVMEYSALMDINGNRCGELKFTK